MAECLRRSDCLLLCRRCGFRSALAALCAGCLEKKALDKKDPLSYPHSAGSSRSRFTDCTFPPGVFSAVSAAGSADRLWNTLYCCLLCGIGKKKNDRTGLLFMSVCCFAQRVSF